MATRRDNPACCSFNDRSPWLLYTRRARALPVARQTVRNRKNERRRRLGAHDLLGNNRSETRIPNIVKVTNQWPESLYPRSFQTAEACGPNLYMRRDSQLKSRKCSPFSFLHLYFILFFIFLLPWYCDYFPFSVFMCLDPPHFLRYLIKIK